LHSVLLKSHDVEEKRMKETRILVNKGRLLVVLATVAAVMLPVAAQAQEAGVDYTNTVTVASGATVEMEADIATISFGVRAGNLDASEATRTAGRKTQTVVAALRRAGVTEEELTVGGVNLSRRTDRKGNFIRYVASVTVKVKTTRLDALAEIIDAAVAAGASSIRGVNYDVQDRRAAVDQALREAMQFARAKATALAQAEGRQVGPAIVISEYDSRPPRSVSLERSVLGSSAGGAADSAASYIPLTPPTLEARARITVTFELV
jgi:uncharacterized protein YggE